MILELQRADRMGNSLKCILKRMRKIIHRINAPGITLSVVMHMSHAVKNRISHIDIGRSHVDLGTQHHSSVRNISAAHFFKQSKIFIDAPIPVRTVCTRGCQRPACFPDLICGKFTDIGFSVSDKLNGAFIHTLKIIRGKVQVLTIVCAQPLNILFDRIDKLFLLFSRVRIVKTQIELTPILFGQS